MSYQAVRCEHCGDPAAHLKSGKVVRFRNEPICALCAAMLGQENPREFLDFLRKGGKVVGGDRGRQGVTIETSAPSARTGVRGLDAHKERAQL